MSRLVSPNEMMQAAKDEMLQGREPHTYEDRVLIVNFVAFNLHKDVAASAMKLFTKMYPEEFEGITDQFIEECAAWQHREVR